MFQFDYIPLFAIAFFLVIIALLEIGRRIGERRIRDDPEGAHTGVGAIEGAIFGLLGLLIAFTFSGAAERMGYRRTLIVAETNAMGTAWLRLDLLPAASQPALRELFRDYVDQRIGYFHNLHDPALADGKMLRSNALQNELWTKSVAALEQMPAPAVGVSLLQALNEMIDITTTRSVAMQTHPPLVIYLLLAGLTLISSLFIGFGMAGGKRRNWLHSTGYALTMVTALYVIIDFELPRLGVIRVDQVDQVMVDLRATLG
ncbi:MAG: DUF4239 domain-containing protein [Pseudomonas sp.]